MVRRLFLVLFFFLAGCASYYDDYNRYGYHGSYTSPSYHYSYSSYPNLPGSPFHVRPLTERDFYMLDNYPGEYFETGLWQGVGSLSNFAVRGLFRGLTAY